MKLSRRSVDAIVGWETGGRAYYESRLARPSWPGGQSGVTVGVGFDLGYASNAEICEAWMRPLGGDACRYLLSCQGVRGAAARAHARRGAWLKIPWGVAVGVFEQHTLPGEARKTARVFRTAELLPPDAQGALVSLVYNRGTSLDGPRRAEMREIASILNWTGPGQPENILPRIADLLLAMRRLWVGQGLNGVATRREGEAALVLHADREYAPKEIIECSTRK